MEVSSVMSKHRFRPSHLGLLVGATMLATVAGTAPVGAASGDVTVTGGSVETIELTIDNDEVDFGSNLSPDGTASDSVTDTIGVFTDPDDPSTGACYTWAGEVEVSSNENYFLKVTAAAANSQLDFLTSAPTQFSDCAGEPVDTAMFASATPAGAFTGSLPRTAEDATDFWLGLSVLWSDAPSATAADATLTISTEVDS
jgi:hypothetical protein